MKIVIFVHPGYLRRTDAENVDVSYVQSVRDDPRYGSYNTYLENLTQLQRRVEKRCVFVVETLGERLHPYHVGFEPQEKDVVLEWSPQEERLQHYHPLVLNNGTIQRGTPITEYDLVPFLLGQGIDGGFIAGELGPYAHSPQGCVGGIFEALEGMSVKGVQNCIFPLVADRHRLTEEFRRGYLSYGFNEQHLLEHERLVRALYDDAVSIEEVVEQLSQQ